MLFPTLIFGLFFIGLYILVWAQTDNEWRKIILLAGSWVFYGAWDWRFVALLIASAVGNWAAGWRVSASHSRGARRMWLTLGVVANLTVLGVFKYYGFFAHELSNTLALLGWPRDLPLIQVLLPVGVSFFTFQGISYIVDVAGGKCAPARLLDVTLLMSFFAHLVAGPIVRATDLLPQFAITPRLDRDTASRGLTLIAWGLFKKIVIASQLSTELVDPVFRESSRYGGADVLAAIYGYAVQIFCDFSAYSDMAIGLAALLGYNFAKNFDQPYRAVSLQDFWRRWHISLSFWLRDYLYIPLGGSRLGLGRACVNLLITMLLGGLWHGADVKFIIWGGLHGGVLCLERIAAAILPKSLRAPHALRVVATFHVVCLGWVFFRAQDFGTALQVIQQLAHWNGPLTALTPFTALLIAIGLAINWVPANFLERLAKAAAYLPAPAYGAALGLAILIIDAQRPAGVAPFIYFQF